MISTGRINEAKMEKKPQGCEKYANLINFEFGSDMSNAVFFPMSFQVKINNAICKVPRSVCNAQTDRDGNRLG